MEHICSPWRYKYISTAGGEQGCVFCRVQEPQKDDENYIVYRGELNFVILNLFPYTSGHLMIAPMSTLPRLPQSAKPRRPR